MVRPPASMLPCLAMRRTGSSACANTGASAPNSTMAATAVNVFIANLPFTFCSVDAAAQVSSLYLYDQGTLVAIRCVIGILLARALRRSRKAHDHAGQQRRGRGENREAALPWPPGAAAPALSGGRQRSRQRL